MKPTMHLARRLRGVDGAQRHLGKRFDRRHAHQCPPLGRRRNKMGACLAYRHLARCTCDQAPQPERRSGQAAHPPALRREYQRHDHGTSLINAAGPLKRLIGNACRPRLDLAVDQGRAHPLLIAAASSIRSGCLDSQSGKALASDGWLSPLAQGRT